MRPHEGDITTPIPRTQSRSVADRVRVRRGLKEVEANTESIRAASIQAAQLGAGSEPAMHSGQLQVKTGLAVRNRIGLKRGTVVGGTYRITDRLGRGGTAIVYRAWHLSLDREVALKVLTPPGNANNQQFEARFVREAHTLARLSHPNIVEVVDFGRLEDGRCYLAMEFLDGPRLTEFFQDPNVSTIQRMDALIQVAQGLSHAHARGIVHRDIKLSNAMVVDRGGRKQVKVLDFGLAKLAEDDQEITQAGITMGSPHFMSPEQARGLELDPRTDVYSLGILAWVAFTGELPFVGDSSTATMVQHCVEPIPWLSRVPTLHPVPEGMCATVRRSMAKDREDRFGSAKELLSALQRARAHASVGRFENLAPPAHVVTPPPANQRPQRSTVRLALLAALLIGTACLWWQDQGLTPAPWTPQYHDRMNRPRHN